MRSLNRRRGLAVARAARKATRRRPGHLLTLQARIAVAKGNFAAASTVHPAAGSPAVHRPQQVEERYLYLLPGPAASWFHWVCRSSCVI